MNQVRIRYHQEPEGWWADSPDLPGFSAAGETFSKVRDMAIRGVEFATEQPVDIVEEGVTTPDQT